MNERPGGIHTARREHLRHSSRPADSDSSSEPVIAKSQTSLELDPGTKVGVLLCALPSVSPVLKEFGISADTHWEYTLSDACAEVEVPIATILAALDKLDWGSNPASE